MPVVEDTPSVVASSGSGTNNGHSPLPPKKNGPKRHTGLPWLPWALVLLLLVIAGFEGISLYSQKRASDALEAQSAKTLGNFLGTNKAKMPPGTGNTDIQLKNILFCWTPAVCINASGLSAQARPVNPTAGSNFDDLNSFLIQVGEANVLIRPKVLEGMFNDSVFNYPGSKLRNLTVTIEPQPDGNYVRLDGQLNFIFWIPFQMLTRLAVDKQTNTLNIIVSRIKVLGFIPATPLIRFSPFELEKLLTLPPNNHLSIHENQIKVKPFGLFPPPRINGTMDSIRVGSNIIQLRFKGETTGVLPGIPQPQARNFIYLYGGRTRFSRLQMNNTQIQVIDRNPGNMFTFFIRNYQDRLPQSQVKLLPDGSVVVTMPDAPMK